MFEPRLDTARLSGRPLLASDTALTARIMGDPATARWLSPNEQPFEPAEIEEITERYGAHWTAHRFGFYALFDGAEPAIRLDAGRFVGWCGVLLNPIDGRGMAEIGWAITAEAQGRGYATEAATAVLRQARDGGFGEMAAYTRPENRASRRVMEKLGFAETRRFERSGHAQILHEKRPL